MSKIWIKILVLSMVVAVSAKAQLPTRLSTVSGTVLDPSGASVPEATVILKQGSRQFRSSTKTDTTGVFQFKSMPEGTFTVEVQHEGFKVANISLQISKSPTPPLTIRLELADILSEVSVDDSESTSVSTGISENANASSVNENLLDKLPVFDQDYVNTMSMFLDAGSLGTSGTQLIVDGMAATSIGVTTSAIQEVRINQNPYSAEYARPGRASIEIITKTSTPEYHGTVNFIFRDSTFNARDPFALQRAPEQRRIFEGALSGPVGHSKTTSFLFSANRQEEDLQSTVFASLLSGVTHATVPSPKRNTQASFRLSHQFNENHSSFWHYNEWDYPSTNQGVGGFVLPEAATNLKQWEREFIFNDRLSLSPHWLTQFQILAGLEYHSTNGTSAAQKLIVRDAFTSGGAQIDQSETEAHFQLNEIVSWSSGKHLVKFGLNIPDWSRRGINNQNNFGGTYFFSSLDEFAARHPFAFRQQTGSGHVVFLQKELGGFVQDEFRLRPNLSLALGLRFNWQNYLDDNKDFAPRIAFAYSPGKKHKTVLRGGAGIFYDRTGAGPIADTLLYNGKRLKNLLIVDPNYPNPFSEVGSVNVQPTEMARFDPNICEPYTLQYSVGVERQIAKRTTMALSYNGSLGVGLFRSRDINAPVGPDYQLRPNPELSTLRQIESSGRQTNDSLEIMLRGEITKYFTGLIQYTLSRTNNNTGGIAWYPANQYDLSGEWSRADFDQRHRFNMLESFSPGKLFTLGIGFTLASGKPYSLTTGDDTYHTGFASARPPGIVRNTLTSPGFEDLDVRWSRDFRWSKVKKDKGGVITIAFDGFNVLNHVDYVGLVGNLSSPFFGKAVAALPTRRLQLTLRIKF